ncbi:hypothetical protein D3C87_2010920 [compost metagenome]
MFIFLPGKAHFTGVNFEEFCQRIGDETGIAAVFQDSNQNVFAFAIRLETEIFHHHEIFRVGF